MVARVILALVSVVWFCPGAHGGELLRWKLKPGQTLQVELTQKSELETTAANKPLKMNLEMFMGLAWQVESVDDQGTARIAQSFTRLRLKMDVPKQEPIEYDSASKVKSAGPAKDVADAVGPLIGAKFFITMTSRGEIESVEISDEAAKLLDNPAGQRWKGKFSKESLGDLLRESSAVLPEKPVEVGSTWTVPVTSQSPAGPIKLSHEYTYQGPKERSGQMLEAIAVKTSLQLETRKGKPELKKQKHEGQLYFDAQAGRFVETQISQELVTETPYRDSVVEAKATSTLNMKVLSP